MRVGMGMRRDLQPWTKAHTLSGGRRLIPARAAPDERAHELYHRPISSVFDVSSWLLFETPERKADPERTGFQQHNDPEGKEEHEGQ